MDCTNAADTGASMHSMQASSSLSSLSYFSYPLSLGQQALWVLYKTAPESVAYNLSGAVAVPGDTNLDALRSAFQKLAERHPMLRTTFASLAGPEGEPVQRVSPSAHVDFRCEDAVDLRPAQLDERLASEIYRPFDLERGPAWRVVVFEHAPVAGAADTADTGGSHPEHLVLLVFHHILGDLWSFALMTSEIASLYREAASGNPAALRPMRATYADYVTQEAERLAGPQAESSWDYWRTRLAGDLPSLDLPPDRPRLSTQTGRGAAEPITIDRDLTERLRRLAEHCHVAVHTVLLTAFQTLLHRYSGQDDLLVGVARAGRSHTFASVVGYFINPVVMRADFSGNPRVVDLLRANQHATEESAAHDWYPFPRLVQRLRPPREFGRSPLFQAMFSWQKTTALVPREKAGSFALGQGTSVADFGGLLMRPIATSHRVAPMDLTMEAAEGPDGLVAGIEYSTDLFHAATIARMAASYRILLEGITSDPEREVALLPIMPDAERQEIVEAWNATTAAAYPSELCLHQLVEQQAAQTPDALAVVCGQQRLTYRELNQQANQLAHYLRHAEGVGPDTPVGLLCVRSAQALVGLLAILKAGGAYVPLDPGYPDERLAFMLHDSAAPLLLTQQGLGQRLLQLSAAQGDAQCGVRVISLDADGPDATRIHQQPTSNLPYVATPDQLAYLIYTSGSTGQPNGVALAHRGVVNLLSDMDRRQPLASGAACSWWTSLSFDVSVYEIFSAWLAGATLHVIPEEARLDAPVLLAWLAEQPIQSAYLPPFLLEDYAGWLRTHPGVAAMRRLLVGVEPIPEQVLLAICAQLPDLCLVNGYGPSETTICSTLYPVRATPSGTTAPAPAPAPPPATHQQTPIGRPVANTQVYVLDQHQQPVPVGVVGEVYIGGVGLARGYWRRPELTAERFLPNPFSSAPGARLYRTGDLARWLPDGNLVFVGRRDSQVKLRGTRIELGEIEAALAQHPQVKQAVVLLRDDPSGDLSASHAHESLVAYCTPCGTAPRTSALRRFLSDRLPKPMIPADFVMLDAFPLTPSGKVDRRALPVVADATRGPERPSVPTHIPAYSPLEQYLMQLWQDVLHREHVGLHDDFFELGGNSLLGAVLVHRLHVALHEDIALTAIFDLPTIAKLATYLEERHAHGVARLVGAPLATPIARQTTTEVAAIPSALVAIQPKGTRPPLFCIHPAGGVVFPYYTLAPYLGNDQPVYGIQDPCLYHTQSRFDCIEDMAAQYVEALQAVQRDGPYYLMGWSVGGLVAYEMAQQLERNGQQVAALILLDARAPALPKRHAAQSFLRNRVQRLAQLASIVQALPTSLPNSLKAAGSVVKPILSYVHSGLFLLATSARRRRPASGKQPPAAMDLLRWAGLDTWRARLFTEAAVATTVSREASLQLIELPAVRRVLDLVRIHTRLARRYSVHTYSGRITLFRAVPAEQSKHQAEDPTLGWGNLAERGVEMHTIRANHVALFVKPYVEILAQELKACLERSGSVATGAADEQPRPHA